MHEVSGGRLLALGIDYVSGINSLYSQRVRDVSRGVSLETVRAGATSGQAHGRGSQVGAQSHRRLRGRRAKCAKADATTGGREGRSAAPGVSRSDRAFADARGTAGLRGGQLAGCLRKGGGPAAR